MQCEWITRHEIIQSDIFYLAQLPFTVLWENEKMTRINHENNAVMF